MLPGFSSSRVKPTLSPSPCDLNKSEKYLKAVFCLSYLMWIWNVARASVSEAGDLPCGKERDGEEARLTPNLQRLDSAPPLASHLCVSIPLTRTGIHPRRG